jgi:hypothetical protein
MDLQPLPEQGGCGVGFAVDEETAKDHPVHVAGRLRDEHRALLSRDHHLRGHAASGRVERPIVIRREDDVGPSLPLIWAGNAHVHDEAEVRVVDGARAAARRNLDDGRALAEVEERGGIDGVRIPGEEERGRVHQPIEEDDLVRRGGPELHHAEAEALDGGCRNPVQERLYAAQEVEVVEHRIGGFRQRASVEELELPDSRLDDVGRHDRLRNLVVVAGRRICGGHVSREDRRQAREPDSSPLKHRPTSIAAAAADSARAAGCCGADAIAHLWGRRL